MAALKLDMTIPLANNAGHVQLIINVGDVGALSDVDRAFLADTCAEVCAFAGRVLGVRVLDPLAPPEPGERPPATVYDPNNAVLNGVTGSRMREKL